jgi:uncharacterized membrane protein YciS (DUF1049 family)
MEEGAGTMTDNYIAACIALSFVIGLACGWVLREIIYELKRGYVVRWNSHVCFEKFMTNLRTRFIVYSITLFALGVMVGWLWVLY